MTKDEFEELWDLNRTELERPLDLFFENTDSEKKKRKEEILDRVFYEAELYLVYDRSEIPADFWKGNESGTFPGVASIFRKVLINYLYLNPEFKENDKDFLRKYPLITDLFGVGENIAFKLVKDVVGMEDVSPELILENYKEIVGGRKPKNKGKGKRILSEEEENKTIHFTKDSFAEEYALKYRSIILRYAYERLLSITAARRVNKICMNEVLVYVEGNSVTNNNIWVGDAEFPGLLYIVVNACADYLGSDEICQEEISETRTGSLPQIPDIYAPDLLGSGIDNLKVNLYALYINYSLRDERVKRIWLLLQMFGHANPNAVSDISDITGIQSEKEVESLIWEAFSRLKSGVQDLINYLDKLIEEE